MRIGPSHQAGSDSLLTAATFFKLREVYFNDQVDDNEYSGRLYGLGSTVAALSSSMNGAYDSNGSGLNGMGMGMGLVGLSAMNAMRSGVTIAERERTPLPRETMSSAQGLQGQGLGGQGQGVGVGVGVGVQAGLPTPGLTGFPHMTAFGMPTNSYMRGLGGER